MDSYVGVFQKGTTTDALARTNLSEKVIYYSQTDPIYVGQHAELPDLLYASQNTGDLVPANSSQSNFLPAEADKACVLRILRQPFGDWFFTGFLSGCEVWIATRKGKDPVMFHVNTVGCEYTTEDLTERENMAIAANEAIGSTYNYTLVYRLMRPYPNITAIGGYLTEFHNRRPNIRVGAYAPGAHDGGTFYGQYPAQPASDNTVVYAGWSFRCKNSNNINLFNIGKSYMNREYHLWQCI